MDGNESRENAHFERCLLLEKGIGMAISSFLSFLISFSFLFSPFLLFTFLFGLFIEHGPVFPRLKGNGPKALSNIFFNCQRFQPGGNGFHLDISRSIHSLRNLDNKEIIFQCAPYPFHLAVKCQSTVTQPEENKRIICSFTSDLCIREISERLKLCVSILSCYNKQSVCGADFIHGYL